MTLLNCRSPAPDGAFADRNHPQRRELLGYGIGTPRTTISVPLGFDLDGFLRIPTEGTDPRRDALRAELGVADLPRNRAPIIGIVGRLVPIKAHEVFLDAARAILKDMPEARLAIAGEGERRADLQRLAEFAQLVTSAQDALLRWVYAIGATPVAAR